MSQSHSTTVVVHELKLTTVTQITSGAAALDTPIHEQSLTDSVALHTQSLTRSSPIHAQSLLNATAISAAKHVRTLVTEFLIAHDWLLWNDTDALVWNDAGDLILIN